MNETNVTYNHKSRQWELTGEIDEIIAIFPPGPEGRQAAIIAQLEIEAPAALALALAAEKRWTALSGRAIRAAQLVVSGNVHASQGKNRWNVESQSNPRAPYYGVENDQVGWVCSCEDWQRGLTGERHGAPAIRLKDGRLIIACKHILAVQIINSLPAPWAPKCPSCGKEMLVKRQQNNGSNLPFWSCCNFPFCKGRLSFQPHPNDLASVDGDGREALFLSLERAQREGRVTVAVSAQRRARQRKLKAARARMAYEDLDNRQVYP